jgi:hypothetical protein
MAEIAASQLAMSDIADDQTFMQEVAASQTAMTEVGNSSTARAEVYASGTALAEIRPVDQAIAKLTAGEAGRDASNFPDMATLAGSRSAMDDVAGSLTAMQEVAVSQTAMQGVANSQVAVEEIGSNSHENIAAKTVLNSSTATAEFKQSSLLETDEKFYNSAFNADGVNFNRRAIVTQFDDNGAGRTQLLFRFEEGDRSDVFDRNNTFIIRGADVENGFNNESGNIGITGIFLE